MKHHKDYCPFCHKVTDSIKDEESKLSLCKTCGKYSRLNTISTLKHESKESISKEFVEHTIADGEKIANKKKLSFGGVFG